jgi:hypothetical membrane protein
MIERDETMNESLIPAQARPTTSAAHPWTLTRVLLAIGGAGPLLFPALATLAALVAPGYSMLTQPVSELALGPTGWIQSANFYLAGLAIIAFAVGMFRSLPRPSWVATVLLVISGAGMVAAGIFPCDPKGQAPCGCGAFLSLDPALCSLRGYQARPHPR